MKNQIYFLNQDNDSLVRNYFQIIGFNVAPYRAVHTFPQPDLIISKSKQKVSIKEDKF